MSGTRNLTVALALGVTILLPASASAGVFTDGSNQYNQLGDGHTASEQAYATTPQAVKGLGPIPAVAHGRTFNMGVLGGAGIRRVYAWGQGTYGQLGNGPAPNADEPQVVPGLEPEVVQIAAGENFALALEANGNLYAWGYSEQGQTGVYDFVTKPHLILTGINHICAGPQDGYAINSSEKVLSWGQNDEGQLGRNVGAPAYSDVPGEVEHVSKAVGCAGGGDFALAQTDGGGVQEWGENHCRTQTPTGVSEVSDIAAGWSHALALKTNGDVIQWGCFLGSEEGPHKILGDATAIGASGYDSSAVAGGVLWTLGTNALGELGLGSLEGPEQCPGFGSCATTPQRVTEVSEPTAAGSLGLGIAPEAKVTHYVNAPVTGSLAGGKVTGTFTGYGALHGNAQGTLNLTDTVFGFLGIKVSDSEGSLTVTSIGVGPWQLPTDCTAQSSIDFQTPSAITTNEVQASGESPLRFKCGSELGGALASILGFLTGENPNYTLEAK